MDTTSASLLEELRQPNQHAWSKFVTLYTPLIFYWARRTGLQPADAADLVQEVFAILVVKLPEFRYDKSKSFRAWLRTVTLNKWRELRRRKSLGTCQPEDELSAHGVDCELEAVWEVEYKRHLLTNAIQSIEFEFPQATWNAFRLYAIQGLPVAEVARDLSVSEASVYGAKSRILSRLRQFLEGQVDVG